MSRSTKQKPAWWREHLHGKSALKKRQQMRLAGMLNKKLPVASSEQRARFIAKAIGKERHRAK